jgi:hypothetical protein
MALSRLKNDNKTKANTKGIGQKPNPLLFDEILKDIGKLGNLLERLG